MTSPLYKIGPRYCFPCKINLKVDTENGATYIDNHEHFKVKKVCPSLHHRRVLQDAAGNPIVNLYKKFMCMHERWEVYKGENNYPNNLLFSVKQSSMFQWNIELDVFLAYNSPEEVCDFKVKSTDQSCVIYAGDASRIIAQIKKEGFFKVSVLPNIDYAFIVSLLVILSKMEKDAETTDFAIEMATGIPVGP